MAEAPVQENDDSVKYTEGRWECSRGMYNKRMVHTWQQKSVAGRHKGLIIIVHGYGAHGRFPSVNVAAYFFAARGYMVHAMDAEGHGGSAGLSGLLPDWQALVSDQIEFVEHIRVSDAGVTGSPPSRAFLLGTSMGGAIAVAACLQRPDIVDGLVLLAPMLKLKAEAKPPEWQIPLLHGLSALAPHLAVLGGGSSSDSAAQFRDPEMLRRCDADERTYRGKMRLGTAAALYSLTIFTEGHMQDLQIPFLVMHGTGDSVVDPASSQDLHARAAAADKTLRLWEGALHTLICEPPATRAAVLDEAAAWLAARSSASSWAQELRYPSSAQE